jgi:formylglycine-generating enzyme required for sulfatase activity
MEDAQQTNELVAYCDEETPAHRVVISRPFYMAINEITIEEYRTVMEHVKNKSLAKTSFKYKDEYQLKSKLRKDKYPASNVPWDAADMFCKQLSKNTGMVIRLPTEAEWEYACKAGSGSLFGNGNTVEALSEIAWYEANSDGTHHPVGMKSGNRYGLHDMLGNAGEWCLDGLRQYTAESVVDPVGNNGENTERCVRGGWSTSAPWGCRTSRRFSGDVGDVGFGFRIIVAPYEIKIMP